jgi:integrase
MQVLEDKGKAKVNTFLDSIGRNSISSKITYRTGLIHFNEFLKKNFESELKLNPEEIIPALQNQASATVNVYEMLDQFVSYLSKHKLSIPSIKLYVAAVRSYLEFYDIDIVLSKFKRRVKMPKHYRDEEQPIDVQDIRNLLLKCNNRRLKAYLLVLSSSGLRTIEACALRIQDADFSTNPTKIHVRREYSKTRRPRDVYISQEATSYLQDLIKWKYRGKQRPEPDDLIFTIYFIKNANPKRIYSRVSAEFERLLAVAGMNARKDNSRRHKITLHSLRRFCKGIVSDQAGSDYSEWFLGHNHSVYWTRKEQERRNIYLKKCMPYLTILDYTKLDTRSKNIELQLQAKDKAIQQLTKQVAEMQRHQSEHAKGWQTLKKEMYELKRLLDEPIPPPREQTEAQV